MSQEDKKLEPRWYVVHTYSGYENKVKTDLEKTIKRLFFQYSCSNGRTSGN